MKNEIEKLVAALNPKSEDDYRNALKEILQKIALLGLWRAKFFEHAAFYGGSALRICHGLDRFSEDLDFSLIQPNSKFDLSTYGSALERELAAFGLEVSLEKKNKNIATKVESAFLKANTMIHFLKIDAPFQTHKEEKIKIKLEVDTDPAQGFGTEAVFQFEPIPYSIRLYDKESLFAGKMHALLCRRRNFNVKGRDWYDFIWYLSHGTLLNLTYLKNKMVQTEDWSLEESLRREDLIDLLCKKIDGLDLELAKKDVLVFLKDKSRVDIWSKEFFLAASQSIKVAHR